MHICRCIFKADSYTEVKNQVFVNAEHCVLFGRRCQRRTGLIIQGQAVRIMTSSTRHANFSFLNSVHQFPQVWNSKICTYYLIEKYSLFSLLKNSYLTRHTGILRRFVLFALSSYRIVVYSLKHHHFYAPSPDYSKNRTRNHFTLERGRPIRLPILRCVLLKMFLMTRETWRGTLGTMLLSALGRSNCLCVSSFTSICIMLNIFIAYWAHLIWFLLYQTLCHIL